jgi:sensor histidine kinase regulating citrate/malate metabolism
LENYLNDILKETKQANEVIVIPDNPISAIILNNKKKLADEQNTKFELQIKRLSPNGSFGELPLTETEQCSLLGNILDNALEACSKIENITQRWITLLICRNSDEWQIDCQNSYAQKPILSCGQLVTTKKDSENHGIGTKAMQSIIKKHNGTCSYDVTDDKFEVCITIPLTKHPI